jgi:hypothetical protein
MSFSRRKTLSAGFVLCILASSLPVHAQGAGNAKPTMAALVAREIAALELVDGGTQLTTDERRQAAEAVASAMRSNPKTWLQNDAIWSEPLKRAAQDRAYAAALRRSIRYGVEEGKPAPPGLEQAFVIERQIIHRHDPTIVFDPQRSLILTESSLRDLRTASEWLARQCNLPAPSENFTEHVRDWLRANFIKTDNKLALAVAIQGESFPFLAPALAGADPQRKEAALQQARLELQAADPTSRDLKLAGSAAVLGALAEQQARTTQNRSSWIDDNPLLSKSSKDILKVMFGGGAVDAATAHGLANADIFRHDIYRH